MGKLIGLFLTVVFICGCDVLCENIGMENNGSVMFGCEKRF